jgi:hypothetical protein
MLYEMVLGLTMSSYSLVSHPKASIGYVPPMIKDEEIFQQELGGLEMKNVELMHKL